MRNKLLILAITVLFLSVSVGSVYAVELRKVEAGNDVCGRELAMHCLAELYMMRSEPEKALRCLKKHTKDLSPACRERVESILSILNAMVKAAEKAKKKQKK